MSGITDGTTGETDNKARQDNRINRMDRIRKSVHSEKMRVIKNPLDNSRYNNYIAGMDRSAKEGMKQVRAFNSLEEEVFVNFARTMDALWRGVEQTLKPAGLSPTQYNVLRILRGAGPEGLACRAVGERMLTRDPDMTRLLDRLEARGLVTRSRENSDRRVITTRITPAGLRLVRELDEPIAALHRRRLGPLGARRLKLLNELLNLAREAVR